MESRQANCPPGATGGLDTSGTTGGLDTTGAPIAPSAPATPPALPRPRMPLSQRAKIFIPFDPLKGYQDALREKEREAERLHYELAGPDFDPANN